MIEYGVTVVHFVPSMLAVFVAEPRASEITSLRYVFASGEALPAQTAARLRDVSTAELHNLYGPTEAAVDVTSYANGTQEDDLRKRKSGGWGTSVQVRVDHGGLGLLKKK